MSGATRKTGKPLVTANQVTIARLVLLPLGAWLLYQGPLGQWVALVSMTLVGCTDFVDGWLARRYGTTVLGGLMDPIADKMFIALTMLPALDLGWFPTWVVAAIFLREFVVTAARTAYSRRDVTLRTLYIAKVKTWYQMISVGLLFLTHIDPSGGSVRLVLAIFAVAPIVGGLLFYVIKRRVWRGSVWFAISFGAFCALSYVASVDTVNNFLYWSTVAITWASGGAYLLGIKDLPGTARMDAHDVVRLFGAIVPPLLACVLVGMAHDGDRALGLARFPALPIFSLVACEFAIGGLDNLLAHQKHLGSLRGHVLRVGSQALLLGAALWAALSGRDELVIGLSTAALAVTLIHAAAAFYINRRAFLEADVPAKAVA